jgi:hypothetical protein
MPSEGMPMDFGEYGETFDWVRTQATFGLFSTTFLP